MAEEEDKALAIEKFDGTNFGYWRLSPWEEVASPFLEKKHKTMKDEDWNLLSRKILRVIRLILLRLVLHNVVKENTTMDLMKVLSGIYEKLLANNIRCIW